MQFPKGEDWVSFFEKKAKNALGTIAKKQNCTWSNKQKK